MKVLKRVCAALALVMMMGVIFSPVKAEAAGDGEVVISENVSKDNLSSNKGWAAAITIGAVAAAGAIGMAIVISKSVDGISRQPEAEGKIRTAMMLGLVFVETAIIYALIVAILIIFVL